MAQVAFNEPPLTENRELNRYLFELHQKIFGIGEDEGSLDEENVKIIGIGVDHGVLDGLDDDDHTQYLNSSRHNTAFDNRHNAISGKHSLLKQAVNTGDISSSIVTVTSPDADLTYNTNEMNLINELKVDVNALVVDINRIGLALNTLMGNMRTANLIG